MISVYPEGYHCECAESLLLYYKFYLILSEKTTYM